MKINTAGLKLLKAYEGLRLNAYPDPGTGSEPWTIGYGHTAAAGDPDVKKGDKISKARAEQILHSDLSEFEQGVERLLKVKLNDNQFSALVCFAFNVGLGAFAKSSVLHSVNSRKFNEVPRRLNLWVKAGGRVLPGLVKRRAAEGLLFQEEPQAGRAVATASLLSPTEKEVEEKSAYREQVTPEQGKSFAKSKTVWATVSGMALGAYAAGKDMVMDVYAAASVIGLEVKLMVSATVAAGIVGAGMFIIHERGKKSRNDGI